jgi:hypothetical protein
VVGLGQGFKVSGFKVSEFQGFKDNVDNSLSAVQAGLRAGPDENEILHFA